MVRRKLNALQLRVKELLLAGNTIPQAASRLEMNDKKGMRKIRQTANQLECYKEIRRDPTIHWPILYIEPYPATEKAEFDGGCVASQRGGSPSATEKNAKVGRVHLNGFFHFAIKTIGNFSTIRDNLGCVFIEWKDCGAPNGCKQKRAELRLDGNEVKILCLVGKNKNTLSIYPGESYQEPPNEMSKGEAVLRDRAVYIAEILHSNGWRWNGDIQLKGTIECGHVNHPFMSRMDRNHIKTDATVKIDTSPEVPEIELTDEEANNLLCFTPEHITALYANDEASDKSIKNLRGYIKQLQIEHLEADKFLLESTLITKKILVEQMSEPTQPGIRPRAKSPLEGYL